MAHTLRQTILSLALDSYGTEAEYPFAKYPGYAVLRHPNGKWYGVIMDLPRRKLGLTGDGMVDAINIKCDPSLSGSLRLQPGILPGYHMNKEQWITILLDGSVDAGQIAVLLDLSFTMVGVRTKKPRRKQE